MMPPGRERRLVTSAMLLGITISAIELTAVAAAMPSAVAELGGMEHYSWVFSIYLLTSTATIPLYGKLADLYGRRRLYGLGVLLFLIGSALCGTATSMTQLILFRALQGLGAGGVMPITATLAGDIYTLEERAYVQGLFAGTWAVFGMLGPVLGGWITDTLSWRWIFFLGIPFGLLSILLMNRYLTEKIERRERRLDVPGTFLLMITVTSLLLALTEGSGSWGWEDPRTIGFLLISFFGFFAFLRQEKRAAEPMLPLDLFRIPVIAVASVGNFLLGTMIFGLTTWVPVLGQGVLGGTATEAGFLLIPLSVGWTISSTIGARLMLHIGYRRLTIAGTGSILAGSLALAMLAADTSRTTILLANLTVGLGAGMASLPYLLGVQNAVSWERRGVATGTVQFFRSIGGAVAVAVLGAIFNFRWHTAGIEIDPNAALTPAVRETLVPAQSTALQGAFLDGLQYVFLANLCFAVGGLLVSLRMPGGSAQGLAHDAEKGTE